jgi:hypothetical protein
VSSLYLAFLFFFVRTTPIDSPRGKLSAAHVALSMIQAVNFLIVSPLNRDDLVQSNIFKASSPILMQVCHTMSTFFLCLRGINTPWQVKSIPPHPRHLAVQAKPVIPRRAFLARQATILAWQYLALNALVAVDCQANSFLGTQSAAVPNNWGLRIAIVLTGWFIALRLIIDSGYRALSLVAVALTTSRPGDWPPFFGRMRDAYTLRAFWG